MRCPAEPSPSGKNCTQGRAESTGRPNDEQKIYSSECPRPVLGYSLRASTDVRGDHIWVWEVNTRYLAVNEQAFLHIADLGKHHSQVVLDDGDW